MTASATHNGALKLRAKALDMAGELMQQPPDALDIVDGEVIRKDQPAGPSMTLGEIAQCIWRRHRRRAGNASRASRPKAGSTPSIRSIPTASTSRW